MTYCLSSLFSVNCLQPCCLPLTFPDTSSYQLSFVSLFFLFVYVFYSSFVHPTVLVWLMLLLITHFPQRQSVSRHFRVGLIRFFFFTFYNNLPICPGICILCIVVRRRRRVFNINWWLNQVETGNKYGWIYKREFIYWFNMLFVFSWRWSSSGCCAN